MSFPVIVYVCVALLLRFLEVLLSYPSPRPAILFEDFGGFLSKGMSQQIRVVRLYFTSFPFLINSFQYSYYILFFSSRQNTKLVPYINEVKICPVSFQASTEGR
jgi:hypothetical protein